MAPVKESDPAVVMGFCRVLCSTLSPPPQVIKRPGKMLTLRSLAEMGFSEPQAEMVYDGAKKNRCKNEAPILAGLLALGLNPTSVVKILEKCPELYTVKESQLQQRIANLRKLGLLEGSLQRVISHYPHILALPVKRVSGVSRVLKEKCRFTTQQVTDILRDSPNVVQEEHTRLEYMFQYAYFRMGCRQAEMVKAKLFQLSMEELQCRHGFLERRGLYQTPDKKGQTLVLNPLLKDFLPVSEETYLSKIAAATQEEFNVFRKLMAREQEEQQEWKHGEEEEEEEEEDEEDEEEEEEWDKSHIKQHFQNTSYNKKRKRRET
ncbi:hypothetical protein NFI96_014754 [Prochilodus magdalenae]|nr:hypothetical protein NFI96_014754 [Prochilodus magdalenae]